MDGSITWTLPQRVTEASIFTLAYIAQNLRANDRVECFAGRIETADQLAAEAMLLPGIKHIVWLGEYPVAAVGSRQLWPGVWTVWAWGTDQFDTVATALTRHIIRTLQPAMQAQGLHRAECYSWVEHTKAHDWLEFLGFEREGILRGYGRNQEDFVVFGWRKADVHRLWWGRRGQRVERHAGVSAAAGQGSPG